VYNVSRYLETVLHAAQRETGAMEKRNIALELDQKETEKLELTYQDSFIVIEKKANWVSFTYEKME